MKETVTKHKLKERRRSCKVERKAKKAQCKIHLTESNRREKSKASLWFLTRLIYVDINVYFISLCSPLSLLVLLREAGGLWSLRAASPELSIRAAQPALYPEPTSTPGPCSTASLSGGATGTSRWWTNDTVRSSSSPTRSIVTAAAWKSCYSMPTNCGICRNHFSSS